MRATVVISAVLTLLAATPVALADAIDPAQAIAQKFYEADEAARPQPPSKPKSPHLAKSDSSAPNSGGPGLDYEMDMLRRAQAEEAERQKEIAAAPIPVVQPAPAAAPPPVAEPAPTPTLEPDLAAEPIARVQPLMTKPRQMADAQGTSADAGTASSDVRATVLLVLDPDDTEQEQVKSDPIVCFDQQCWISNGLDAPAKPMPRSEAIALKTTETPTGDSCSGKSGCAFRNVAFHPDSQIQVVEVGESRGVADGAYTVAADTTCRKLDGNLTCDNALVTHAFRMWVVPETTAQQVGPSTLEDAVADGLQDDDDDNAADGK